MDTYREYETDLTRQHTRVKLQSKRRSHLYRVLVYSVLRQNGLYYTDLVEILAPNVDEQWAHARQQQKRRKTLAATTHVIAVGQRDIARYTISAAVRNHRIEVKRFGNESKRVWLDTPPASGGEGQIHIDWSYEWNDLEDIHRLLHPGDPFIHRTSRVESSGSGDGTHP